MKPKPHIAVAVLLAALPMFYVSPSRRKSEDYVQGTVVGVESHRVESPEFTGGGSNPSDAPRVSRYYVYEVSIRVGCKTYVGRYETPFHYLPSVFAPAERLEFRLTKHVMDFDVPYRRVRMGIVRRHSACGTNR